MDRVLYDSIATSGKVGVNARLKLLGSLGTGFIILMPLYGVPGYSSSLTPSSENPIYGWVSAVYQSNSLLLVSATRREENSSFGL